MLQVDKAGRNEENRRIVKILIADKIDAKCSELLRANFDVDEKEGLSPDELAKVVPAYDALLVRGKTKVSAKVISAGAKENGGKLKAIGRAGIGVDTIDVAAARSAGILVFNAPGASTLSVAEHAIGLLFALAKHIVPGTLGIRGGEWPKDAWKPRELAGKMLGIVGFGRIGRKTAELGSALGMGTVAHDPFVTGTETVEKVLESSDAISIHLPLTSDTKNLLNAEKLALMKASAYLINTSRGEVVDLNALLGALEEEKLAGAGLDVFPEEPPPKEAAERMAKIPTLIATPHIAGSAVEAQARIAVEIAETMTGYLLRGEERNIVT